MPVRPEIVRFGLFEVDLTEGVLIKNGRHVKLQEQPFRILSILLEHPGETVSREQLRQALWKADTFVDFDRGLNAAMAKLRQALGDSADNPRFIETLARRGYRFIGPVFCHSQLALEHQPCLPVVVTQRRWKHMIAVGSVAVGLGVALVIWFAQRKHATNYPDLRVTPLTTDPGLQIQPSFSPDGSRVAYAWKGPKDKNFGIYVKLLGSGDPVRITDLNSPAFSPVWSPDGQRIAFLRDKGAQEAIVLLPASGGRSVELTRFTKPSLGVGSCIWYPNPTNCGYPPSGSLMAWSSDGKYLITSGSQTTESPAIIRVSVDTGEQTPMTVPHRVGAGDVGPALSPNGRTLAFIRASGSGSTEVYVMPLSEASLPSGPPRQLTFDSAMLDPPAWTADGRELLFASDRGGRRALWRVLASGTGKPVRLAGVGENAYGVAVSPHGQHLVYGQRYESRNLWKIPIRAGKSGEPVRVTTTTKRDTWAHYSPDGRRITFESDRSGVHEIWVCNANGSNTFQLTNFGKGWSGSPRWSPDGMSVAFDSNAAGNWDIYMVRIEGGPAIRLTTNAATDAIPNWSREGDWIYFTSNRTGRHEIWKIRSNGSSEMQVTTTGGIFAVESPDGQYLYYKTNELESEIRKMPVKGGPSSKVLDSAKGRLFTVSERGIYFATGSPDMATDLRFLDFASKSVRTISAIGNWGSAILSPDERWALYSREEVLNMNLMLVENFR